LKPSAAPDLKRGAADTASASSCARQFSCRIILLGALAKTSMSSSDGTP
jgi:hypothetical protein